MSDPQSPPSPSEIPAREVLDRLAAGRASALKIADGRASLVLDVAGMDRLERDKLEIALIAGLKAVPGISDVRIAMTAERPRRRLIAVGSGKGGVGKSTVSANLAIAMARLGRKVGLVDADIYGPSQTRLLACEGTRPEARESKMIPVPSPFGVSLLSMGMLVEPGQAIAWRGPMAGNALGQLIDAEWGDVQDIIIDLPPGTGDVQLTMLQKHKPVGAVIVSTPQDLALMDAMRAISLFDQGGVPIIGMVENMAGYACPHCGEISDPFGVGGAEAAAGHMGHDFLGRVPLALDIRKASDAGMPPAAGTPDEAAPFAAIAARVVAWLDAKG